MTSVKEMRNYIRQEAKRAEVFKDLDEKLTEIGSLEQMLKSLSGERDHVRQDIEAAKKLVVTERAKAASFMEKAELEAVEIRKGSENVVKEAQAIKARAQETLDNATQAAANTAQIAARDAKNIVTGITGDLAVVKAEIVEAKAERTRIANDVAALEKRRDMVAAEFEALRKKFG